ncbi:hypothetical protein [Lactobacillus corticis]|uniref:Uncharacterized protein n=1 Tax=Lactobacillus corticis TaxID=2201249 RepID=A0A916VHB3_9LACO|nr:hypothetical protein [Lactobacillus corticis]GFZ26447.1 hypothetical protein LCB40_03270 [Lactobacillus corticis]
MNKLRKIVLLLSGITIIAIILMFIQSLGNTYVESSSSSYSIYKMNGGEQTTKFNSIISQYAKKHNISVLKVFTVLPEKSSNSDAVSKIHVYGKNLALPKGTRATKKEFETSGVYFSYYFVGKTNPASIERMFDKNGIKYNKINESWIWDISNYLEASSMGYVFLIVLVILLVVLLLTNLRELKKMNIRALLGVSNSRDAWESF